MLLNNQETTKEIKVEIKKYLETNDNKNTMTQNLWYAAKVVLRGKFFVFCFFLWLCWIFVSVQRLSPVVASGGHSSLWCVGLSPSRPLLFQSTGSRRAGSAVVAHGPSCSAACGILPDQGSNPCPPHWQADSQPLHHQGSPKREVHSNKIPPRETRKISNKQPKHAPKTTREKRTSKT